MPEQEVSIRRAAAADYAGVRSVLVRVLPFTDGFTHPGQLSAIVRAFSRGTHAECIEWFGDGYLVAEVGGEIVGYAMASAPPVSEVPQLSSLYVVPEWQGRRIGSMLTDACVRHLRALGHSSAVVVIQVGNARARRFYERRGAYPIGEHDGCAGYRVALVGS